MKTRRAHFELEIKGRNVTADLAPYLLSASFTDNADSEQADSIDLELEDRDGLWRGDWLPVRGDRVTATLVTEHWKKENEVEKLCCGSFEIDEISHRFAESGDRMTLRAVSAMVKSSIRREKKSRAWESVTLSRIVRDIAKAHKFEHVLTGEDVGFLRVDQREESDIAFLRRLAGALGYALKLAHGKVIVMDEHSQESGPEVGRIVRGEEGSSVQITESSADVYRACRLSYQNAGVGKLCEVLFTPDPAPKVKQVLKVFQRVESAAAARRRARTELRRQNQKEVTGSVECMGNLHYCAGAVVLLSGFSRLDGRYFIESATHRVDAGGYASSLRIRRVLGY